MRNHQGHFIRNGEKTSKLKLKLFKENKIKINKIKLTL